MIPCLHFAALGINQTGEGQMVVFHACLKDKPALRGGGRGRRGFGYPLQLRGKSMKRVSHADEEELNTVAEGLMQLTQVNHLPTEDVSGEAAEDEENGLAVAKVAEVEGTPILQGRQTKIWGRLAG
jgi:hypothetical protein